MLPTMPLFDYMCARCDDTFEALVSRASATDVSCPACGSAETERSSLAAFAVGSARRTTSAPAPMPTAPPCGSCGDPRGPGACQLE